MPTFLFKDFKENVHTSAVDKILPPKTHPSILNRSKTHLNSNLLCRQNTAAGHFFNHFGTKVTFMYVSCFTCHIYTPSQLRAMIPRGLLMIISIHCIYLPPLLSCYPLKHEKALKIASYHCHVRTIVHSVTASNRTSTGGMSDKIKANHRNWIDKWACSIILNSLFYWFSIGKQNIHIYIYVHPHCITY